MRSTLTHPQVSALALFAAALFVATPLLAPRAAYACGGCFSPPGQQNSQLIVQNAERVLFHQDPTTKKTLVWVEVRFSGLAKDFGWVLPLPKQPKVSVGSSWVFDQLDQRHAPRFATEIDSADENCRSWSSYCFGDNPSQSGGLNSDRNSSFGGAGAPSSAKDGESEGSVTVLEKDQAGPYDYEIIASTNAAALLKWLNDHGYDTPAKALPVIESHLAKGDVFVAVKLSNDSGVNEIKPIVLEMDDAEACVPLRLTAIAAAEDMSVVVTLAGAGRGVPKNHLHVELNPLKLNWFENGNNYAQVMAAAIDEAAGRAFVTEYSANGAETQLVGKNERMNSAPIALVTDGAGLATALLDSNLIITEDSAAILEKHTGLAKLSGQDPLNYFAQLRSCGQQRGNSWCAKQLSTPSTLPVDGVKVAAALDKEFIVPIHTVSDALAGAPKVTRLVMRISPDEMDRDPIFAFNSDLPDVANEFAATFRRVCSTGWYPYDQTRLTIKNLGSWVFDGAVPNDFNGGGGPVGNNAADPRMKASPMAMSIALLDESGAPKPIAASQIELVDTAIAGATVGGASLPPTLVLKPAPARVTLPKDDGIETFVLARDDSMCTVKHIVVAWAGSPQAGVPGSGTGAGPSDASGGCTASPTSRDHGLAGLLMLLGLGAIIVRRRQAVVGVRHGS